MANFLVNTITGLTTLHESCRRLNTNAFTAFFSEKENCDSYIYPLALLMRLCGIFLNFFFVNSCDTKSPCRTARCYGTIIVAHEIAIFHTDIIELLQSYFFYYFFS